MNSRAILVNLLVIIIILAGGGAAAYYYNQSANYIKTDNAQVSGQAVTVASPGAGKLTGWNAEVGKTYTAGSTLGNVEGEEAELALRFQPMVPSYSNLQSTTRLLGQAHP